MRHRSVFVTKEYKNEIRHYYGKEYEIIQLKSYRISLTKDCKEQSSHNDSVVYASYVAVEITAKEVRSLTGSEFCKAFFVKCR
jgi:hypothetical protein